MRVLLICQYFAPETGGPPNRMLSFVRGLIAAGHEVEVIAEKPSHPEGVIWSDYRGGWTQRRNVAGASVDYVWVFATPRKSALLRIANYLSFMVAASLRAVFRRRADIVLASSPPLFVGVAGWLAALRHRSGLVLDVRDLWPDAAVALGELRGGATQRLAVWLERFLYRRACAVVAATDGFCSIIRARARPGTPIELIRNGAVPELYPPERDSAELRQQLGLSDYFVVAYVGNLGIAQGLDHIVDAANRLAKRAPRVRFLLVGQGPRRPSLEQRVRELGITNVVFHPRVGQQQAAALMQAADALIVSLRAIPMLDTFIPSKLFDAFAAGRPVLAGADGETRNIVEAEGAGLYYPNEDGAALAERVLELLNDPGEARSQGARGRHAAVLRYSRANQAEKLAELLSSWRQSFQRDLVDAHETEHDQRVVALRAGNTANRSR